MKILTGPGQILVGFVYWRPTKFYHCNLKNMQHKNIQFQSLSRAGFLKVSLIFLQLHIVNIQYISKNVSAHIACLFTILLLLTTKNMTKFMYNCTPCHPQTIIPNNTVWFEENQLSQLQCKTDLSKHDATRLRQDYFSSEKVS